MKSKRENERQRKCLLHPPLFRLLEVVKMSANDCFCEWASGAEAKSSERRKRLLGLENITPTLPPFCTWQSNESKQWAVWVARYWQFHKKTTIHFLIFACDFRTKSQIDLNRSVLILGKSERTHLFWSCHLRDWRRAAASAKKGQKREKIARWITYMARQLLPATNLHVLAAVCFIV
jgi:hypothetical protein